MPEIIVDVIKFYITYGFTIMFFAVLALSIYKGYKRGLRKSAILLANACVCAVICLVLFIFLSENSEVDVALLSIINFFMNSKTGLQDALNVSHNLTSLREVLVEAIPKLLNYNAGLTLVLEDNGAYLLTLVDITYKAVFGFLLFIIFYILLFITFIFSKIIHSQKRYIKKRDKEFLEGESEESYKPKRFYGALIGGFRGLVNRVVILSFVGSLFFVVTGGKTRHYDIETDDETTNQILDIYNCIGSYGEQGIFKVLNAVSDKSEVPYYLYVTDLVYQGKLTDDEHDIETSNVYLRREFTNLTKFSYDAMDLLLKYRKDEILDAINAEDSEKVSNILTELFKDKEFNAEFKLLIYNLDTNTYFINLSKSLLDSIVSNIASMDFASSMPSEIIDLLQILFSKGYYSSSIPFESYLKEQSVNKTLPYVKPSTLLTKDDIQLALDIVFDAMEKFSDNASPSSDEIIDYVFTITNKLHNFSIFSSSRKNELNLVYGRLYQFVEANYINNVNETRKYDSTEYYISEDYESIDWIDEMNALLDVSSDAYGLYNELFKDDEFDFEKFVDMIADEKNNDFDTVLNYLLNSKIANELFNSSMVKSSINEALQNISSEYIMPDDIDFTNVYDQNSTLIKQGDLTNLVYTVKGIARSGEKDNFMKLLRGEYDSSDSLDLLESVSEMFNSSKYNNTPVTEYISNSTLLNSVFTSVIFSNDTKDIIGEESLYSSIIVKYSNGAKTLDSNEFKLLFENIDLALDIFKPIIDDSDNTDLMLETLKDTRVNSLLQSKIIEGIASVSLHSALDNNEDVVLPSNFVYLSTKNKTSEVKTLINIIQGNSDIEFKELIDGENPVDYLLDLDEDRLEKLVYSMLESKIFYYTISKTVTNYEMSDISLIYPDVIFDNTNDSNLSRVIKKEKITSTILSLKDFKDIEIDSENFFNLLKEIYSKKDIILGNEIIGSSIINYIITSDLEIMTVPKVLTSHLSTNIRAYEEGNIYYNELEAFLDCTNLLFDFNKEEMNNDDITNHLINEVKNITQTKLERIYNSYIMSSTISKKIKEGIVDYIYSDVLTNSNIYETLNERYTCEELYSFIKGIRDILQIDLEKLVNDSDSYDFFNKILNLNLDDYQEMWNSNLLSAIISNEVELNLYDSSDTSKQYINNKLFNSTTIKSTAYGLTHFYYEEIYTFVEAIKSVLEVETSEDLQNLSLDTAKLIGINDKLDTVYSSVLFVGVLSKMFKSNVINASSDKIIDTPLAYIESINEMNSSFNYDIIDDISEYSLYKEAEFRTIIDLYKGDAESNMLSGALTLTELEKTIWTGNKVNSYIVYASISNQILDVDNLSILKSDLTNLDTTPLIKHEEITNFINACQTLGIESIGDFTTISNIELPTGDEAKTFFKSDIIRVSFARLVNFYYNDIKISLHIESGLSSVNGEEAYSKYTNGLYLINCSDIEQFVNLADNVSKFAKYNEDTGYTFYDYRTIIMNLRLLTYDSMSSLTKLFLTDYLMIAKGSYSYISLQTSEVSSYDLSETYDKNYTEYVTSDEVITETGFNNLFSILH